MIKDRPGNWVYTSNSEAAASYRFCDSLLCFPNTQLYIIMVRVLL
jgi:hypothetical protein